MRILSELSGLARFAIGVRSALRETITPDAAHDQVRRWIAERDARFLSTLERAVYGHSASPYRTLLEHAGCGHPDVVALVREQGLEGALERLQAAGVYVTWEELKGRVPAVRGSRTFRFRESDFDNPLIRPHFGGTSGGSSGTPVRVRFHLEEHWHSAPDWAVLFAAHGWLGQPLVIWATTHAGLANRYLRCAKFGARYDRWFTLASRMRAPDRISSALVHRLARWGAKLPRPEPAPVDRAGRVLDYLLRLLATGSRPVVSTSPSAAARVSIEAQARGADLAGVSFLLGSEPVTPARRATIEACGAAAVPTYGTSECGWIGAQFPGATVADEVHLFRDAYAAIHRRDPLEPGSAPHPILLSGFRTGTPKVLLNAEIGDSGVITAAAASGPAADLGFTATLHTIRPFRKLTTWGTTFAHADLYQVLEEALPRRLGGGLADFQLVERSDDRGLPRLVFRVSPALGPVRDEVLRSTLLSELGRIKGSYLLMAGLLEDAGAVEIERRHPVATARGKILPVLTEAG